MEKLNNELLKEPEADDKEKSIKRNSKEELIHKIVELSKNNDIKLEHRQQTEADDQTTAQRAAGVNGGEDHAG